MAFPLYHSHGTQLWKTVMLSLHFLLAGSTFEGEVDAGMATCIPVRLSMNRILLASKSCSQRLEETLQRFTTIAKDQFKFAFHGNFLANLLKLPCVLFVRLKNRTVVLFLSILDEIQRT